MSRETLTCPYCGHDQEAYLSEIDIYDEDALHEEECEKCGKHFGFNIGTIIVLGERKVSCFNGHPHKWKLSPCSIPEYSKMECTECGEERELTDGEHKKFGIGYRH